MPRRSQILLALAAVWLLFAAQSGAAHAAVLPTKVLTGPNGSMLESGNVAISEDGTGGAVFVASENAHRHIYASLLRSSQWSEPQRIDKGQEFDSYSPRIAVGDGGRAVVIWVQRGPEVGGLSHDQLYSSTLDPGASSFEFPVLVDYDVGPAEFVTPDIAMNAVGTAYLAYRNTLFVNNVGTQPGGISVPTGFAFLYERVARYNGWTWSKLDQPANRNVSAAVRFPSPSNAPKVSISASGTAAIAFQEPDSTLVSRIWVRKIFGGSMGLPLLASPSEYGGVPLRGDADAIALSAARSGAVAVAFRQAPGSASGLDRTRIMANRIADPTDVLSTAFSFSGSKTVDSVSAAADAIPGQPNLRMNKGGKYVLTYALGTTAYRQSSDFQLEDAPIPVGQLPADGTSESAAYLSDVDTAVDVIPSATGGVWVAESTSGTPVLMNLQGGGSVTDLHTDGNNSGDAVVSAVQKVGDTDQLMVAAVDSPPDPFQVNVPGSWVKRARPGISWFQIPDGSGPIRYEVSLDHKVVASTFEGAAVFPRKTRDGRHRVSLTAIDAIGQRLAMPSFAYKIDRAAPTFKLHRLSGRRVRVTVLDGTRSRSSGISTHSRISWGDGSKSKLRRGDKTHRYNRGGSIALKLVVRDKAGNARTSIRRIRL